MISGCEGSHVGLVGPRAVIKSWGVSEGFTMDKVQVMAVRAMIREGKKKLCNAPRSDHARY